MYNICESKQTSKRYLFKKLGDNMFGSTYFENALTYREATEINQAMGRVYLHMGLAVLTSMITSMLVASSPALMAFLFTGIMKWVVIFLPLVAVFGKEN